MVTTYLKYLQYRTQFIQIFYIPSFLKTRNKSTSADMTLFEYSCLVSDLTNQSIPSILVHIFSNAHFEHINCL